MLFRRISLVVISAIMLFACCLSASAEQYSFPWVTPSPTPVKSSAKKETDSSQTKADEVPSFYVYAPVGFDFCFRGDLTGAYSSCVYHFKGKGSAEPSLVVYQSMFVFNAGMSYDGSSSVFSVDSADYSVVLSDAFGHFSPSYTNCGFAPSQVLVASVHSYYKKIGNLYINVVAPSGLMVNDASGNLVGTSNGGTVVVEFPSPTPDPLESYRPVVDEGGEAADISSVLDVITVFSSFMAVMWSVFPYFGVMFLIVLIAMYLKTVLSG